jgi:hypothetical protein
MASSRCATRLSFLRGPAEPLIYRSLAKYSTACVRILWEAHLKTAEGSCVSPKNHEPKWFNTEQGCRLVQVLREMLIPDRPLGAPAADLAEDERDAKICERLTGQAPVAEVAKQGTVDGAVLKWSREVLLKCEQVADQRSGIAEYVDAYGSVCSSP